MNTVKLDLKDKKLLYELDFNGRATYAELAKKVGMSKQGVEYKLNNLIRKGVIKGFYPVINVPKMGYFYCRLGLILHNVTKEKETEIIQYAKGNPRFFWIFTTQGLYDLLIVIWCRTLNEFRDVVDEVLQKYGTHIHSKMESIGTDVIHYQHRYLLGVQETKEIHIGESHPIVEVDNTDKRLLTLLCEDARRSLVDMGQHLGMTPRAVSYRIKRLQDQGIILGYRPSVDHQVLGYAYYKLFFQVRYAKIAQLKQVFEYLKRHPLVIYVVKDIGVEEDLDVELMAESGLQLYEFVTELKHKFPGVLGEYRTFMFVDTKKVRYLPF